MTSRAFSIYDEFEMKTRIEIKYKIADTRAEVKKRQFESLGLKQKIRSLEIRNIYTIDADLAREEIKKATIILANPLIEEAIIDAKQILTKYDWVIEIGFLPGVTDNIANTTRETIEDLLKKKFKKDENVYSSVMYIIEGKLSEVDIKKIAESLFNPLIERASIKTLGDIERDGMEIVVSKVELKNINKISEVDLNIPDEELEILGKQGIKNFDGSRNGPLALDLNYLKTIKKYFEKIGRNPTDIELESIAQTWSEHCKHTIFADPIDQIKDGLYKSYIKKATQVIRKKKGKLDFCISVFSDNAGGIEYDENYIVSHKVETHNSPSALDPFGGAITGIVGVNRDAIGFGMGAKPVINTYGFCLANPKEKRVLYRDAEKTQKLLSPKRIMEGVIHGVNVGGNCSGIPTAQGFLYFDERFRGKPLVFVGTVGLLPKKNGSQKMDEKKARPGDLIVVVGGRVGQDGIHGATFSSEAMDSKSPATAVQIGDPITQKKFSDAIVKEARDLNLYNSITDNGAGGISCSVAEMAKESGGCLVNLERVPLKYPGLEPWKIWISESQERMTLAVPRSKWPKFLKLMKSRGVEATIIGAFNHSGRCIVKFKQKTIVDIEMEFLHNGLPKKKLETKKVLREHPEPPEVKIDFNATLSKMLKRPNISSFDFISAQYDHEVQGGSIIKPIQGRGRVGSDTAVMRPILDSKKGVILSYGINPGYSDIDTYHMAASAIDSAIRGAVSAGADIKQIALLDNFCWCSSTEPERLYELKRAVRACYDYAVKFETPFISGKDSMFNDFKGFDSSGSPIKIAIPPTLLISSIAVTNDVEKSVSIDAKFSGDLIYLLGETHDELGASEYYALISEEEGSDFLGNNVPKVDWQKNKKLYSCFYKAVKKELIVSAVSVGRGGLGIALCKTAMAGGLGLDISIGQVHPKEKVALFSESQGRILVTINSENQNLFEKIFTKIPKVLIGKVTDEKTIFIRSNSNKKIVSLNLDNALKNYRATFKNN